MKQNKSLLLCCLLLILSSTITTAQSYNESYNYHFVTLRSDFPSKSVLISNLLADRAGDGSPVIGAASWPDSGRQLECRSLLQFNYKILPGIIINDPSLITSAELLLYPLHVDFSDNDLDKPSRCIVRRVTGDWEDSTTMWTNQPVVDSSMQVVKMIKKKQKNDPVSIDVTKLVLEMLRYGNKGFMICNENPVDQSVALGQLFASPRNDNEDIRPVLVINFRMWGQQSATQFFAAEEKRRREQLQYEMRQQYMGNTLSQYSSNTPVQQPVITTPPVKD